MKRLSVLLLLCLLLSGCGGSGELQVQVERQAPPVAEVLAAMPTEPVTVPPTTIFTEPTTVPTEAPTEEPTEEPTEPSTEAPTEETIVSNGQDYVLNKNTKKFHFPHCSSVKRMKDKNRWDYFASREEIIGMGYDPCKNCNP